MTTKIVKIFESLTINYVKAQLINATNGRTCNIMTYRYASQDKYLLTQKQ